MKKTLTCLLVLLCCCAGGIAYASGPTLHGRSSAHVLQKVTFRATGLKPASGYALRITRTVNGRRCAAFLSGPRRARGTETFHGSVPNGLQCAQPGGGTTHHRIVTGRYNALACVPTSFAGGCRASASVVRRPIRITR